MAKNLLTGEEIPDVRPEDIGDPVVGRNLLRSNQDVDVTRGIFQSLLQGATLGWGDEITAGIVASIAAMTGDDFQDAYFDVVQSEREGIQRFQDRHRAVATGAEVAGGALTALLGGAAGVLPRTFMGTTAAGAGVGAVAGAGQAEDIDDIPAEATIGATLGAGTAGVLKGGSLGLRKLKTTRAGRVLRDAIERTGETFESLAHKVQEMGPNARIVDVLPDLAETVGQIPAARPVLENFLEGRAGGQQMRILGSLSSLTRSTRQYWDNFNALDQLRKQNAGPLYTQAYEKPLEWSAEMTAKVAKLQKAVPGAWRAAKKLAELDDVPLPDKLPARMTTQQIDYFKRGIDDVIPSLSKRRQLQRGVSKLKNDLIKDIDAQNPTYAAAREAWAGPSEMLKAQEAGRKILTKDFELSADEVKKMTAGEKEAYVIGAVRAVRDRMLNVDETRNQTKIFKPLLKERLKNAFPDEDSFDMFTKTLESENTFTHVRNQVLAGSPTARRLISQEEIASPLALAATGHNTWATLTLARGLASKVLGRAIGKRLPEDTAKDVADLLVEAGNERDVIRLLKAQGIPTEAAEKATAKLVNALSTGIIVGTESNLPR